MKKEYKLRRISTNTLILLTTLFLISLSSAYLIYAIIGELLK